MDFGSRINGMCQLKDNRCTYVDSEQNQALPNVSAPSVKQTDRQNPDHQFDESVYGSIRTDPPNHHH